MLPRSLKNKSKYRMEQSPAERNMRRYEVAYRSIGYCGVIQHQKPASPK